MNIKVALDFLVLFMGAFFLLKSYPPDSIAELT